MTSELKRTKYALDCVKSNKAELRLKESGETYQLPGVVNTKLQENLEIYVQSLMDDLNKLVKE